jgi:hypothetical protein
LDPERQDDLVSLNIQNPESVDFGLAREERTRKPSIVSAPLLALFSVESGGGVETGSAEDEDGICRSSLGTRCPSRPANDRWARMLIHYHPQRLTSPTKSNPKPNPKPQNPQPTNSVPPPPLQSPPSAHLIIFPRLGLSDSVLAQLHLTHSASVEFLRQFWMTYLSTPTRSGVRKKELASLAASLKRALERMEAVRTFAVKEGGEGVGETVGGVLSSVRGAIDKALGLWERGE